MGILRRTLGGRSTQKLAQMLVEGTSAGITACVKAQNSAPNASAGARQLSDELLEFQRENLQSLERCL